MQRMRISNVVMGICKSKNIHYNGQNQKNKRTINELQNTTRKVKNCATRIHRKKSGCKLKYPSPNKTQANIQREPH